MGKGGGCIPSKRRQPPPFSSPKPSTRIDAAAAPIAVSGELITQFSSSRSQAQPRPDQNLRLFIVFYSMYGHVEILAKQIKTGVDTVPGVEGVLYRVPETLPTEALQQMQVPEKGAEIPVITPLELAEADGILFGFPTRFGAMAAQMQAFFESTGGQLWNEQRLAGKPAGFFISTGTQGGGQESTAWTAITQLVHHGMIYVPIGHTFGEGMSKLDEIRGGSPYGAGVIAGDGSRPPSVTELALAEHHGRHMASLVKRLAWPTPQFSFSTT